MKNKNWFWGLFFLLAAVFVVAGQVGFFGNFGLFTIVASVLLLGTLISSFTERNYFMSTEQIPTFQNNPVGTMKAQKQVANVKRRKEPF